MCSVSKANKRKPQSLLKIMVATVAIMPEKKTTVEERKIKQKERGGGRNE